ncbi:MAG: hypothetical protein ACLTER_07465 [Ruminococcus sp.]
MMLIFTILSRVSDSVNVIQIQTKNPANQMITHEVKGSGKVEGSQEVAVFVLENLQVEQVMVHDRADCEKRGYFIEAVPEQHSGGFEESGR